MTKYKVGQYVCFNESEKSLNSSFQELEVYDEFQDNQIVVQVGDIIFETWSLELGAIKILSSGGIN